MSDLPADLKYTKTHEWLRAESDGSITVGITEHAQDQLGDMVYVELPDTGRSVSVDEACAVVESVKAASDVYAPIAGEIVAVNEELADSPEKVNQSPYGDGWLLRIKPESANALDSMLDAAAYQAVLDSE
ncbi:MAG: glycine cleavage system protein GcvH [Gammaproteobacteria bacterium]